MPLPRLVQQPNDTPPGVPVVVTPATKVRTDLGTIWSIGAMVVAGVIWATLFYARVDRLDERQQRTERKIDVLLKRGGVDPELVP